MSQKRRVQWSAHGPLLLLRCVLKPDARGRQRGGRLRSAKFLFATLTTPLPAEPRDSMRWRAKISISAAVRAWPGVAHDLFGLRPVMCTGREKQNGLKGIFGPVPGIQSFQYHLVTCMMTFVHKTDSVHIRFPPLKNDTIHQKNSTSITFISFPFFHKMKHPFLLYHSLG